MRVSDWIRGRTGRTLAAAVIVADAGMAGARLKPETVAGWRTYVAATEARRALELNVPDRFLALDFHGDRDADRRALAAGAIVVREMTSTAADGRAIEIDSGLVHHWRGAVFIKGRTVPDLMNAIQFADPPAAQEDVLRSSVLSRGPDTERVYLRLQRTKIVTVVYNTEHDVRFQRVNATRAASTSVATRIAEVRDAGTPNERELPLGDDRGFLWGLNAYWRYEAAPGGVIAECESLTLSRDVPLVLKYFVGSIVEGAARESMERTLTALRTRYQR